MDFGAKKNIARELNKRGCEVTVYPADTPAEEVLKTNPDGSCFPTALEIRQKTRRSSKKSEVL